MLSQSVYTLVNQQNGNLSFKIFEFDNSSYFDHIQRNNYFTLIIITSGEGLAKVDLCEYSFKENTLFAFYPYQPFMLASDGPITGISIQFHHDFFCIYRHHKEIAANGILFNNIYQQPFILLDQNSKQTLMNIVREIVNELKVDALRKDEVLVSYLKIFLVFATRIKLEQQTIKEINGNEKQLLIIQNLRNAIEDNFRTKHSASEYANMLHVTPVVLARTAKSHFNKTLSDLITERIIVEAKRELYLTNKTVKEIAHELGYDDEYYFSRVFKSKTDTSPPVI
ncbi:helix-turn-helix transcriptional regulator [Flavobacterium sp. CAU 1735]|uniref:helix-turn-helix domain-containing protein n=1 Tax=Flavobacterium sp. CAU 1735 TaxID=3140361 RepID=UPI0032614410